MEKIDKIEEIDNKASMNKALEKFKDICYKCKSNKIHKMKLCQECFNELMEGGKI